MNIITVTSDSYMPCTVAFLGSLRAWHRDVPVTVYALDSGWGLEQTQALDPFNVKIRTIDEMGKTDNRGGALGGAVHNAYKLDVFLEQPEPYLFLDSDILVLKPLDWLFDYILENTWASSHEGTSLEVYNRGEISKLTQFPGPLPSGGTLNSGVIGCVPQAHNKVFALAREWASQISSNMHGDQGLINLAWYKLRGKVPENVGNEFNGGWLRDDRIKLTNTLLHFARPDYPVPPRSKQEDQSNIWAAWPKGIKLTNLTETDFWADSQPHPWDWLNQCNQRQHRQFVRAMRQRSRALIGVEWLVVENADQAYLLDGEVLDSLDNFWRKQAHRFSGLRYVPTFHMADGGEPIPRWPQRVRRWRDDLMSLIPTGAPSAGG